MANAAGSCAAGWLFDAVKAPRCSQFRLVGCSGTVASALITDIGMAMGAALLGYVIERDGAGSGLLVGAGAGWIVALLWVCTYRPLGQSSSTQGLPQCR